MKTTSIFKYISIWQYLLQNLYLIKLKINLMLQLFKKLERLHGDNPEWFWALERETTASNDCNHFFHLFCTDTGENYESSSNIKLHGLMIDTSYSFLSASPDGMIGNCCGEGLLEIQCSDLHRRKTLKEVCLDHQYHIDLDENSGVKWKQIVNEDVNGCM